MSLEKLDESASDPECGDDGSAEETEIVPTLLGRMLVLSLLIFWVVLQCCSDGLRALKISQEVVMENYDGMSGFDAVSNANAQLLDIWVGTESISLASILSILILAVCWFLRDRIPRRAKKRAAPLTAVFLVFALGGPLGSLAIYEGATYGLHSNIDNAVIEKYNAMITTVMAICALSILVVITAAHLWKCIADKTVKERKPIHN